MELNDNWKFYFWIMLFLIVGFIENSIANVENRDSLTQLGNDYYEKLDYAIQTNYDSCIYYAKKTAEIFSSIEEWDKFVGSLLYLSSSYYYKRDFENFKKTAFKAYNSSRLFLNPKSQDYILAPLNLSFYYKLLGNYDKGIEAIKVISTTINENESNLHALYKALMYDHVSLFLGLKGDFESALYYSKQALIMRLDTVPKSDTYVISNLLSISYLNKKLGNLENALTLLQEIEDILLKFYPISDGTIGRDFILLYEYMADTYRLLENYPQMERYIKKLEPFYKEGNESNKIRSYRIRGDAFISQKNYGSAILNFKEANNFLLNLYERKLKVTIVGESFFQLGKSQYLFEEYKPALESVQKSFYYISGEFNEKNETLNPPLSSLPKSDLSLKILMTKFDIFYAMSRENSWEEESLILVYDQSKYLSNYLNLLRLDLLTTNSKQLITEKIHTHFEKAIEVSLKLYQKENDPQYLQQAYHFAEQNKAITLQESIQENLAKGFGGIPDTILEKEKDLRIEIAFYEKMIYEEELKGDKGNKEQLESFKKQKFDLDFEYQALLEQLEENYPKYHELKYKTDLPSVQDIQNQLKKGEALIEYFVGEEKIYAFVFTSSGLEVVELAKEEELVAQIEQFRSMINQAPGSANEADFQLFTDLGHGLYQQVLEQALAKLGEGITKLIIVPDDVLTYIPFEVLLQQKTKNEGINYNLDNLSYLFEKYRISYTSSSALWLKNMAHITGKGKKSFLGFAPTFGRPIADASRDCTSDELYSLNCNESEIDAIRNLIGGEMLTGLGAAKEGFETMAPDFQILHLATHACVDDTDPMFNKIWLSDDYVSNHDLYNLQLNADLAVLSACNTGSGKLVKGEGVQSLARGFLHAGCPSLVTSLWSVDDCATSDIMVLFYKHLKDGKPKDEALQLAKLDYLKGADKLHKHPYYWAAFVQIGNSEPLDLKTMPSWWVWGGLALLLGGFLYFNRQRQSRKEGV